MNDSLARRLDTRSLGLDGQLEAANAEKIARRQELQAQLAAIAAELEGLNAELGIEDDVIELTEADLERPTPPPLPEQAANDRFRVTEADLADRRRQAELTMLVEQQRLAREEQAQKAQDDALIENLLQQIDQRPSTAGAAATTERRVPQQILQRTDTQTPTTQDRSLFGKISNALSSIGKWFSGKSRIESAAADIARMSDAEVRAEIQQQAQAEAAARDAQAEAYATKLEAGPSTARKAAEAVGDHMTRAFDAAENVMFAGPTVKEPAPKNKIDRAMAEIDSMTDTEVTADVQATAQAEAAARDAQAEAYATKLEAGPSTARKATEAVGDRMTRAFDAAENVMFAGPTVTEQKSEEELLDEQLDLMQGKADLKEGKQLRKWNTAIEKRAVKKGMTKMEALVDRIREINGQINAEGFGESDPAFDPRVAELQYLELLLEEPNFENATSRNSRTAAKNAIDSAKRDIDRAQKRAGSIRNF